MKPNTEPDIPMQFLMHAVACKHQIHFFSEARSKSLPKMIVKQLGKPEPLPKSPKKVVGFDYFLAPRLDWIGSLQYKALHLIVERLTGLRFEVSSRKLGGRPRISSRHPNSNLVAFFYDRAVKELDWSTYVAKAAFYLDAFTDQKEAEREDILRKIEAAKRRITTVHMQELANRKVKTISKRISESPLDTLHYFDLGSFSQPAYEPA